MRVLRYLLSGYFRMRSQNLGAKRNLHPEGRAKRGVSKDERMDVNESGALASTSSAASTARIHVGTTRGRLEARIAEHQASVFGGYTARRRPVVLGFHQEFARVKEAIAAERQVKGWRREKKQALIR
jgi:predicted GIY-YIG superfamily endonuclease